MLKYPLRCRRLEKRAIFLQLIIKPGRPFLPPTFMRVVLESDTASGGAVFISDESKENKRPVKTKTKQKQAKIPFSDACTLLIKLFFYCGRLQQRLSGLVAMIPASGAGGLGFKSRLSPKFLLFFFQPCCLFFLFFRADNI